MWQERYKDMKGAEDRMLFVPGGSQDPPGRLKAWLKLGLGVALLLFFMYVVGPFLDTLPGIKPVTRFIDDSGINAPAFYYTGVEEVGDAVVSIRNSLEYPPEE
jgi:hypothetical protein